MLLKLQKLIKLKYWLNMPILLVKIKIPIRSISIPLTMEIKFKYFPNLLIFDDKFSIASAVKINGTARPNE